MGQNLPIGVDHLGDEIGEFSAMLPTKLLVGFGRIPVEIINLGRTEIARFDGDQRRAAFRANAFLIEPLSRPFDRAADMSKGFLNELTHRANTDEALPADAEVYAVLDTVYAALAGCLP